MRVLEVVDTLTMGGAQRVVERLAQTAAGSDVALSVATFSEPADPIVRDSLLSLGIGVHVLRPRTRGDLSDPRTPVRLAQLVRRHDLVHTHLGTSNVLGAVAGRLARRPSVITLHTVAPGDGERRVGSGARGRAVDWALRSGASYLAAVGDAVRDAHVGRVGARDIAVITNPAPALATIDTTERAGARERLGVAGRVLVAVGRLEPPKGYADLIHAVTLLPDDVTLVIAGEGSLESALRGETRRAGVEARVRFLGNVDDVAGVLAAGDVFVSSSIREGMPMAVLEAMARGLPIVATDVGDVRSTVADAGIVVPSGAPRALADAVEAMLADDVARRHAAAAVRLARDVHGAEAWFARWRALWDAAVAGRPIPAQLLPAATSR